MAFTLNKSKGGTQDPRYMEEPEWVASGMCQEPSDKEETRLNYRSSYDGVSNGMCVCGVCLHFTDPDSCDIERIDEMESEELEKYKKHLKAYISELPEAESAFSESREQEDASRVLEYVESKLRSKYAVFYTGDWGSHLREFDEDPVF